MPQELTPTERLRALRERVNAPTTPTPTDFQLSDRQGILEANQWDDKLRTIEAIAGALSLGGIASGTVPGAAAGAIGGAGLGVTGGIRALDELSKGNYWGAGEQAAWGTLGATMAGQGVRALRRGKQASKAVAGTEAGAAATAPEVVAKAAGATSKLERVGKPSASRAITRREQLKALDQPRLAMRALTRAGEKPSAELIKLTEDSAIQAYKMGARKKAGEALAELKAAQAEESVEAVESVIREKTKTVRTRAARAQVNPEVHQAEVLTETIIDKLGKINPDVKAAAEKVKAAVEGFNAQRPAVATAEAAAAPTADAAAEAIAARVRAMTPSADALTRPPYVPEPAVVRVPPGKAKGAVGTGTVRPRRKVVPRSQSPTVTQQGSIAEAEALIAEREARAAEGLAGPPASKTQPPKLRKGKKEPAVGKPTDDDIARMRANIEASFGKDRAGGLRMPVESVLATHLRPQVKAAMLEATGKPVPAALIEEIRAGVKAVQEYGKLNPGTGAMARMKEASRQFKQLAKAQRTEALKAMQRGLQSGKLPEALDTGVRITSPARVSAAEAKAAKEAGYILAEVLTRMTGSALGAAGGGVFGSQLSEGDTKATIAGVLGGAWVGGVGGSVLGKALTMGSKAAAKEASSAQFFSLLSRPDTIGRAVTGSFGGVMVKALERLGENKAKLALKGLQTYMSEIKQIVRHPVDSYKDVKAITQQAKAMHARVPMGSALNYPGRIIGMFDRASSKAMQAMGYTADEAARMNLSGFPLSKSMNKFLDIVGADTKVTYIAKKGKNKGRVMTRLQRSKNFQSPWGQFAIRTLLPFPRVQATMLENAVKYSPFGMTNLARTSLSEIPGVMVPMRTAAVRAGIGTAGAGLAGTLAHYNVFGGEVDQNAQAFSGPLAGVTGPAIANERRQQADKGYLDLVNPGLGELPFIDEKVSPANILGRMIPSVVGQFAKAMDPAFDRAKGVGEVGQHLIEQSAETGSGSPGWLDKNVFRTEGLLGNLASRLPYLREHLPEVEMPVDALGRPLYPHRASIGEASYTIPDGTMRGWTTIATVPKGFTTQPTFKPSIYPKNDPLAQQLKAVVEGAPHMGPIRPPTQADTLGIVKLMQDLKLDGAENMHEIPPEVRAALLRLRGAAPEQVLQKLFNDPTYLNYTPEMKRYVVGEAINKSRAEIQPILQELAMGASVTQRPEDVERIRQLALQAVASLQAKR